jgi:hypothetical protein
MHYVVLALAVATACYSPQYRDCQLSCTAGQCPAGLECNTGMCRPPGMEGPCPSDTIIDAAPDAQRDLTVAELGRAQLDALCAYFARCGAFEDAATCTSVLGGNLGGSFENIAAAVNSGTVLYHPDRGAACVNRFATLACDRGLVFSQQTTGLDCALTFTGSRTDGQQCALNEQCTSNICNIPACPNACCLGTCDGSAAPAVKNVLESCTVRDVCKDSYCATSAICEPYKSSSTSCARSDECMPGLGCIFTGTTSTCQQLVGTNGPCGSTSQCANLGDVCSGGSCMTGGLTSFPCSNADGCQGFHQCLPATGCDLPPDVSESCANYSQCRTGYCDFSQTCVDKKVDGTPCDPAQGNDQCESGYCNPANPASCTPRPICT